MTKEEILKKHYPDYDSAGWVEAPMECVLSAMDEYADQQTAEKEKLIAMLQERLRIKTEDNDILLLLLRETSAEVERLKAQVNQYNLIPNDLKKIKTTVTDYSKDAPLNKLKNP